MKKFSLAAIAFIVTAVLASSNSDCTAGWLTRPACAVPAACPQQCGGAQCGAGSASVSRDRALAEPVPPKGEPTLAPPRPLSAPGVSWRQEGNVVTITVEVASPK